jgi:hypothetical protein
MEYNFKKTANSKKENLDRKIDGYNLLNSDEKQRLEYQTSLTKK